MEKWIPIFWIFVSGIAIFVFLLLIDLIKGKTKKRHQKIVL